MVLPEMPDRSSFDTIPATAEGWWFRSNRRLEVIKEYWCSAGTIGSQGYLVSRHNHFWENYHEESCDLSGGRRECAARNRCYGGTAVYRCFGPTGWQHSKRSLGLQ